MNKINRLFRTSYSRQALIILMFITAFLFISILLNNFSKEISKYQLDITMQRLEGNASQGTSYINSMFKDYTTYIDSVATTMSKRDDLVSQDSISFLEIMSRSTSFKRLAIDFPDGTSYSSDGYVLNIADMAYTQRIFDQKTFVTDMLYAKIDGQPTISIISPIIKNGKAVAAVRGTLDTATLSNSIDTEFFSGIGYFYLVDSKGYILAKPQNANILLPSNNNFFDTAQTMSFSDGQGLKQIRDSIRDGKNGSTVYTYNGQSRYAYYSPVGINNWALFVAVPTTYIEDGSQFIKKSATALVAKISLILLVSFLTVVYMMKCSRKEMEEINKQFALMTALIPGGIIITSINDEFTANYISPGYYDIIGYTKEEFATIFNNKGPNSMHPDDRRKTISSIKRQLVSSGSFSINVRVQHKTKGYIWVHLQGRLYQPSTRKDLLYIVAVDVSEQLDTLQKLQAEKNFNALIATLSDDGFFDYDNINKSIRYSKNFAERMGLPEVVTNYPESVLATGLIAEDCKHLYSKERFNSSSKDVIEEETHFVLPDGQDVWYMLRYNIIFNEQGYPIRAVGRMTDITKKNVHISHLQDQAQRDPLTDLYNKIATEQLIKELLATSGTGERHALMIIDIDNFKNINDKFGHLYGDVFLKDFAATLKAMFRAGDVVGRIGGDEFFVFLKNFNSIQMLHNKAQRLCKIFKNVHKENGEYCETSVSIGIATYPEHGKDLNTLYQNADKALYEVKRNGKNSFAFYCEKIFIDDHELPNLKDLQNSCSINTSILRSLYNSANKADAIEIYMQEIVEAFNFNRGYVYELSSDQKTYVRTIECLAEGLVKYNNLASSISIDGIHAQMNYVKDKGIYVYRRNTIVSPFLKLLLDEVGSNLLLNFAIMENDQIEYVIGFEDQCEGRKFTEQEIHDLSCVCGLIFSFVSNYRKD